MKPQNLRFRINAAILVTCGIVAAVFSIILFPFEIQRTESQIDKIELLLSTIYDQRRVELANQIFGRHHEAMALTLDRMRTADLVAIELFDRDGRPLMAVPDRPARPLEASRPIEPGFQRRAVNGGSALVFTTPIRLEILERDVGYLRMAYDLSALQRETGLTLLLFLGILISMLVLIVTLLNALMSRLVLKPVSALRNALLRVREGHFGEAVSSPDGGEIGEMAGAFNEMSLKLRDKQAALDEALAAKDAYAARLEAANAELREAEAKYRSIFENASEGILQSTPEGRYISANPAMARLLGYDSPEALIREIEDIGQEIYVNPNDRQGLLKTLERRGTIKDHEVEVFRRDRSRIWISLNARAVRDDTGAIRLLEGSFMDITLRKAAARALHRYQEQLENHSKALEHEVARRTAALEEKNESLQREIARRNEVEAELRAARDAAEAADRAKSRFLAGISHEIRTPMNAIIGMTELSLKTDITDRQHGYLATIQTSARGLMRLLNDILDLSKIEAGKLDLIHADFSLDRLMSGIEEMFKDSAAGKGIAFRVSVDPAVPRHLTGDVRRLRQVLVNLVGNAVKFTDIGEVTVQVAASPALDDGGRVELIIAVTDTGIGILPEQTEAIFRAFTQADDSPARRYEGTGLGLALCRRLVAMMGGTIQVRSTPGEGSRFEITVPFQCSSSSGETAPARPVTPSTPASPRPARPGCLNPTNAAPPPDPAPIIDELRALLAKNSIRAESRLDALAAALAPRGLLGELAALRAQIDCFNFRGAEAVLSDLAAAVEVSSTDGEEASARAARG